MSIDKQQELIFDYKNLREKADSQYEENKKLKAEFAKCAFEYNKLKKDNAELIEHYKNLTEHHEILRDKFNATVDAIKRQKEDQIRELNKELKTLSPKASAKFSPSAKSYSTHKVLNKGK